MYPLFFDLEELPVLDIGNATLEKAAQQAMNLNGMTVPGVQQKLSLHLFSESGMPRLTVTNVPAGYILKPASSQYPCIAELEFITMKMAEYLDMPVVPNALYRQNDQYHYITRRIDRQFPYGLHNEKYAMEDFCQLSRRATEYKYQGSYERCARVIGQYSENPLMDLAALFRILVFSFLTGNSDMHLKNFSLIEEFLGSGKYRLSPAYDLLPVQILIPGDLEDMALTLNGKKQNLRRGDFLKFAEKTGISRKAAGQMIDNMLKQVPYLERMISDSILPDELKEQYVRLIQNRKERLEEQPKS